MDAQEKDREEALRKFSRALKRLRRQMRGVTEEEVLRALGDDDIVMPEPWPEPPKGNGRRGSASTRTASRRD